jgi:thymidylate kinase
MGAQLKLGTPVISDRYLFSSLAYQGVDLPYPFVASLNETFPMPSVVFFIDTPVEECLRRIEARGQAKELFEIQTFLEKVKRNYEQAFSDLPSDSTMIRIDGTLSIEAITGRSAGNWRPAASSLDEHRVPIAEEMVFLLYGVLISGEDVVFARECGHQRQ